MKKTIASITTFKERQNNCSVIIQKLLDDSLIDDVVLYFQNKPEDLDSEIYNIKFQYPNNFYIEFISDKYRSYSKYIYALNNFKDYNILLVDDDINIPNGYLSENYKDYITDNSNIAYSPECKNIFFHKESKIIYYNTNCIYNTDNISRFYLFNSGHLTYFPCGYFSDNFLQNNIDKIFQLFPTSDELSLLLHHLIYKKYTHNITIQKTKRISAVQTNKNYTLYNQNRFLYFDYFQKLTDVLNYYNFNWREFEEEYFIYIKDNSFKSNDKFELYDEKYI